MLLQSAVDAAMEEVRTDLAHMPDLFVAVLTTNLGSFLKRNDGIAPNGVKITKESIDVTCANGVVGRYDKTQNRHLRWEVV